MTRTLFLPFVLTAALSAQTTVKTEPTFNVRIESGGIGFGTAAQPLRGAPYSATTTTEFVQTLADGNHIMQKTTAFAARDSQGRTRNEVTLPMIGNMSAAKAPHLVFINDPVAEVSYDLNLDDQTARKLPSRPAAAFEKLQRGPAIGASVAGIPAIKGAIGRMSTQAGVFFSGIQTADATSSQREDLGTQVMEGVSVQGYRITRSIPAGEVGNEKPIDIVEEVWTSPELKTVVYSKRTDPRSGEQTLKLTNISRAEPDPALFTVPPDFKLLDIGEPGGNVVFYQPHD